MQRLFEELNGIRLEDVQVLNRKEITVISESFPVIPPEGFSSQFGKMAKQHSGTRISSHLIER